MVFAKTLEITILSMTFLRIQATTYRYFLRAFSLLGLIIFSFFLLMSIISTGPQQTLISTKCNVLILTRFKCLFHFIVLYQQSGLILVLNFVFLLASLLLSQYCLHKYYLQLWSSI
jgi:hypothetical protein